MITPVPWLVSSLYLCTSLFVVSLQHADISMYLRDVRLTDHGISLQFYFRSKYWIFEICRHFCSLLPLFLLVTCNVSLRNMNKFFFLIFQCLKDDAKYRNGFFLKPPFCLTAPTVLSLSTFLKHSWFVAQIYIFPCSLSSLSQLWRNYYLCSIWFFMDFIEMSHHSQYTQEIGPLPRRAQRRLLVNSP